MTPKSKRKMRAKEGRQVLFCMEAKEKRLCSGEEGRQRAYTSSRLSPGGWWGGGGGVRRKRKGAIGGGGGRIGSCLYGPKHPLLLLDYIV